MQPVLTVIEGGAGRRLQGVGIRAIPSSQCEWTLHLPGGLNVDPPGSTCRRHHLLLKLSARNVKQFTLLLKRVSLLPNKLKGACARPRMRGPAVALCNLGVGRGGS